MPLRADSMSHTLQSDVCFSAKAAVEHASAILQDVQGCCVCVDQLRSSAALRLPSACCHERLPDPSEQHLLLAALSPCGKAVTKRPLTANHSLHDQPLLLMRRSGNLVTNQSWQDFFLNEGQALHRHCVNFLGSVCSDGRRRPACPLLECRIHCDDRAQDYWQAAGGGCSPVPCCQWLDEHAGDGGPSRQGGVPPGLSLNGSRCSSLQLYQPGQAAASPQQADQALRQHTLAWQDSCAAGQGRPPLRWRPAGLRRSAAWGTAHPGHPAAERCSAAAKTLCPQEHNFTCLVPDLAGGVDPDDAFSKIPYEKGFALLYYLQVRCQTTACACGRSVPCCSSIGWMSKLWVLRGIPRGCCKQGLPCTTTSSACQTACTLHVITA